MIGSVLIVAAGDFLSALVRFENYSLRGNQFVTILWNDKISL
jgi:hypothetical protein